MQFRGSEALTDLPLAFSVISLMHVSIALVCDCRYPGCGVEPADQVFIIVPCLCWLPFSLSWSRCLRYDTKLWHLRLFLWTQRVGTVETVEVLKAPTKICLSRSLRDGFRIQRDFIQSFLGESKPSQPPYLSLRQQDASERHTGRLE